MVAAYNQRARNQGLGPRDMRAVVGDLADPNAPDPGADPESPLAGPELRDFDCAAVAGGLHHMADPDLATKRIVERLRPGGVSSISFQSGLQACLLLINFP